MRVGVFPVHRSQVQPQWADANEHMNLAYYLVMFDAATDAAFEILHAGEAYRRECGMGAFAAETRLVYEREMNVGDWADIFTRVIDADEKRLHLTHEMFREGETGRACLQELMFVNVDLTTRRAAPWGAGVLTHLIAARDAAAAHPRPAKLGRSLGILRS